MSFNTNPKMSFNTNHHDYSKLLANLSARLERCLKAEPEVDHRHELALISAEAQIINRHLLDQFIASLDNEDSEDLAEASNAAGRLAHIAYNHTLKA